MRIYGIQIRQNILPSACSLLRNKILLIYFLILAICAIALTILACCIKRFMKKKREADLNKKESKGRNGVDLKVIRI